MYTTMILNSFFVALNHLKYIYAVKSVINIYTSCMLRCDVFTSIVIHT